MTLAGLKRRGVTSTAINAFVRGIGITRRLQSFIFRLVVRDTQAIIFVLLKNCHTSAVIVVQYAWSGLSIT
jgi:hypothetical protein